MLYLYVLSPIDFWDGWVKEDQFLARPGDEYEDGGKKRYANYLTRAFTAARTSHWEGDVKDGPYISGLPGADTSCPEIMIGWKQYNNGTTFICSPFPLPWVLGDNAYGYRTYYVEGADTTVVEV